MFSNIKELELSKAGAWAVLPSQMMTALGVGCTNSSEYGAYFKMEDRDGRYLLMVKNNHPTIASTVSVMVGDGTCAAGKEPTVILASGQSAIIQLESGRFKHVQSNELLDEQSGVDGRGCVFVTAGNGDISACMFHTVL